MGERTCVIDDCDKPYLARGWCRMHYSRWHSHGDPLRARPYDQRGCLVDGCGGEHEARGYCGKHYQRLKKNGDPLITEAVVRQQCSVDICAELTHVRGMCSGHAYRQERYDDPLYMSQTAQSRLKTVAERFWEKVEITGFCWEWTGAKCDGYGHFWNGQVRVGAHRWAYENLVGSVPDGLHLDHLCRNRSCVNPDHLEPVTQRENLMRGYGAAAQAARKAGSPVGMYPGHVLGL